MKRALLRDSTGWVATHALVTTSIARSDFSSRLSTRVPALAPAKDAAPARRPLSASAQTSPCSGLPRSSGHARVLESTPKNWPPSSDASLSRTNRST
jgi:hypothetical protein